MIILITAAAFITATLLCLAVLQSRHPTGEAAVRRVGRVTSTPGRGPSEETELDKPLLVRLVQPAASSVFDVVRRVTPRATLDRVRQRLYLAGRPWGMEPVHFISLKMLLVVVTTVVVLMSSSPLGKKIILAGIAAATGFVLPDSMIKSRVKNRQKEIQKMLPDTLDLLTVSVEAGLGFDSAVAKVVSKSGGPLSEEFSRVLQEIRVGKPRADALRDLAERVAVDDLSSFVAALVQADQLGVSIGKVLRIQATEMRRKRRQRAEEAAMKAPIKMLIPMVLFIFPTIFVILLGPAVVRMVITFMGT